MDARRFRAAWLAGRNEGPEHRFHARERQEKRCPHPRSAGRARYLGRQIRWRRQNCGCLSRHRDQGAGGATSPRDQGRLGRSILRRVAGFLQPRRLHVLWSRARGKRPGFRGRRLRLHDCAQSLSGKGQRQSHSDRRRIDDLLGGRDECGSGEGGGGHLLRVAEYGRRKLRGEKGSRHSRKRPDGSRPGGFHARSS